MKKFVAGLVLGLSLTSMAAYAAGIIQSADYNETQVIVDGVALELDQPLISVVEEGVDGVRNYMPVRAVLEQMGYTVDWDGENNAVVISSEAEEVPQVANEEVVEEPVDPADETADGSDEDVTGGEEEASTDDADETADDDAEADQE